MMVCIQLACVVLCCIASSVIGQYTGFGKLIQNRMFTNQQSQTAPFTQAQVSNAARNVRILLLNSGLLGSSQRTPYTTNYNIQRSISPRNAGRIGERNRLVFSYPKNLRFTTSMPMSGTQPPVQQQQQQQQQSNAMANRFQYYYPATRGISSTMYPRQATRQVDPNASGILQQYSINSDIPTLYNYPTISNYPTFSSIPTISDSAVGMSQVPSINVVQPANKKSKTRTGRLLMSSRTQTAPPMTNGNRLATGTLGQYVNTNNSPLFETNPEISRSASAYPVPSVPSFSNTIGGVGKSFQYGQPQGQTEIAKAIAKLYLYPKLQQLLYVKSRRNLGLMSSKSRSINAYNYVNTLNPGVQKNMGGGSISLGSLYAQHQLSNNMFKDYNFFKPQEGTLVNPSFLMPKGAFVSKVSGGETEVISADGRIGKLEGGRITFERFI